MPAFTLYSAPPSSNSARVILTLAEGGFTDYELVNLELQKGEQKSPDHMKRHPWGKVPAVTFPDGFTLYESRAICKYMARKYSFPLLPANSDIKALALFDQAQSVEILNFADPAGKVLFEKFVKKFLGLPVDEVALSKGVQQLEGFFDVVEPLLQQNDYMAGNSYTVVDIFYIPPIARLFDAGYGNIITSRKAVNAWWERCANRPAIKQFLDAEKAAVAAKAAANK